MRDPAVVLRPLGGRSLLFSSLATVLVVLGVSLGPVDVAASATAGTAHLAAPGCTAGRHLLPTNCRMYFGAFVARRAGLSQRAAYRAFERMARRSLDIVHVYHRDGQRFPSAAERRSLRRPGPNRKLLVNWKPEAGHTWREVANGAVDPMIDREAAYLRRHFRCPFFLTIHHEPEEEVRGAGSGYTAGDYRAMFRHVVDRLRGHGVRNPVYVMDYMGAQKWAHLYNSLYPGNAYVDWIAFDPYLTAVTGTQTKGFARFMNQYWGSGDWRGQYHWGATHHPHKPIMLAEWGIGEKAGAPRWKAEFYRSVIQQAGRFPKLKAMVYFSSPRAASGNVVPNTSSLSLAAFRDLARSNVYR